MLAFSSMTTAPSHLLQSSLLCEVGKSSKSSAAASALKPDVPIMAERSNGIDTGSNSNARKVPESHMLSNKLLENRLLENKRLENQLLKNALLENKLLTKKILGNPLTVCQPVVDSRKTHHGRNAVSTTAPSQLLCNSLLASTDVKSHASDKMQQLQSLKSTLLTDLPAACLSTPLVETTAISSSQQPPVCSTAAAMQPSIRQDVCKQNVAKVKVKVQKDTSVGVKKSHGEISMPKRSAKREVVTTAAAVKRKSEQPCPIPQKCQTPEDAFIVPGYELPSDDSSICKPLFAAQVTMELSPNMGGVISVKKLLVNIVSASLIHSPNFKQSDDPVRNDILAVADPVSSRDPEFILKLALYTRCELNVRTTANFLLAYASANTGCRPYLAKYYSKSIRLPSDWIEVVDLYQAFNESDKRRTIPAALRKVMVAKFKEFDQYQLAKYNKENANKKKTKKKKKAKEESSGKKPKAVISGRPRGGGRGTGRGRGRGGRVGGGDSETRGARTRSNEAQGDDAAADGGSKCKLTLKQLIRRLHIVEPVENVMCLVGKRYPEDMEKFYQSRLPGTFNEERAGKRMKLPIPETWETQVSLKGNKASTWQDLIDHKKLPFMAMLRNLRNMIKAGISETHHAWVLKKLSDKNAVVNSRQFPFRFFSAYEVLQELEEHYNKNQQDLVDEAVQAESAAPQRGRGGRGRGRGRGGRGRGRGGAKTKFSKRTKEVEYDVRLLERYRKALDKAVQLSTVYNVKPIAGTTIILCDLRTAMFQPCSSARGLGKPRTRAEIGVLLGLMCKYSCEESQLVAFGENGLRHVELEKGTILNNMRSVLSLSSVLNEGVSGQQTKVKGIETLLFDLLKDRVQVNNLILLSNEGVTESDLSSVLVSFREKYRKLVNNRLLYVNVDLGGASARCFTSSEPDANEYDVNIAGFSDQILRFVAERGEGGQLMHIEKIDEAFDLKSLPTLKKESPAQTGPERPLAVPNILPMWRSCRVFISSTFLDMHAERDLLTRFVFPELRTRAERLHVAVTEVDLRWGVTEKDTQTSRSLEICLSEVAKCNLFVGMLGNRYGWTPDKYEVPMTQEFSWVHEYPPGASVTELEIYHAALAKPGEAREKAFFYFRDDSFMKAVPEAYRATFDAENKDSAAKMTRLKNRIVTSGLETYNGYPCTWGGVVDDKPYVADLHDFANRVLNNLWNAIVKFYPLEDHFLDEYFSELTAQKFHVSSLGESFIGRKALFKQSVKAIESCKSGLVVVSGTTGCGKSSLMARLVEHFYESTYMGADVFINFSGSSPASNSVTATLRRLCFEMASSFSLPHVDADDYRSLISKFQELLAECGKQVAPKSIKLFIDGVDLMTESGQEKSSIQWLPEIIPKNVVVVTSLSTESHLLPVLQQKASGSVIAVGALDVMDKEEIVRAKLALHSKKLDETPFNNQMKILLSKKEANVPLYLSLACDEIRVFGVFEKVSSKLKMLPQTIPLLTQLICTRVESDIGADLVSAALSLIASSRNGLTETELHHVLSLNSALNGMRPTIDDIRNIHLSADDLIPSLTMMRLVRALHVLLQPQSSAGSAPDLLKLAHSNIQSIVKQRYIKTAGTDKILRLHSLLAGYYYTVADPGRDHSWAGLNERAFVELPYHLSVCENSMEMFDVLSDLRFIRAKCTLGLAAHLLDDFATLAVKVAKDKSKGAFAVEVSQYESFVSRNIHLLSTYGALTYQIALNEPADTSPARDAKNIVKNLAVDNNQPAVIELVNKPKRVDPCTRTMSTDVKMPTSLATSSNSQLLAAGFDDFSTRMFSVATGKETMSFYGHSDQITSVCFVGTSRLCTSSADSTMSLWNAVDGHRLAVLRGHGRRVNDCVADANGKMLVSVGWDCAIKLWNGVTGEFQADLACDTRPLNCVALNIDNQLIAVGSWDMTVKLYDTFNRQRKGVWRGHTSSVRNVAFSSSGRHVASSSVDGEVRIWYTATGANVGNVRGHCQPVNKLMFSSVGHELITASDDRKIKVWSSDLGQCIAHLGNSEYGAALCVAFDENGRSVATGYHHGHVRMFDVGTGLMDWCMSTADVPRAVTCVRFCKHQNSVLIGSGDGSIALLDKTTGSKQQTLKTHKKGVMSVACGQNYLISTGEDFEVHLYRTQAFDSAKVMILRGHNAPVTCSAFNSDETKLATGGRDACVVIWNLSPTKGAVVVVKERVLSNCHADWINCCDWSNTGNFVVTGSSDFNLKIWDVSTGEMKTELVGHMGAVTEVAFRYGCIVSSCRDGTVKVWSHHGVEITTLRGHKGPVNGCHLHVGITQLRDEELKSDNWAAMVEEEEWRQKHEETKLNKREFKVETVMAATCSDDGTLRLWLPTLSNELHNLTGHTDKVSALSCARDGLICSGSADNTIRLWKIDRSDEATPAGAVTEQNDHGDGITALAASHDRRFVVSGSRDGMLKLWYCNRQANNTSWQCSQTLSDHSRKAVNCMAFVAEKGQQEELLVIGTDDAKLITWKIAGSNNAFKLRYSPLDEWLLSTSFARRTQWGGGRPIKQLSVMEARSPVTSIISIANNETWTVVATHWEPELSVWNINKHGRGKLVGNFKGASYKKHGNWTLCSCLVDNWAVITGGIDENSCLSVWHLNGSSVQYDKQYSFDDIAPTADGVWITSIAAYDGMALAGDNMGNLMCSMLDRKPRAIMQIHQSAVSDILVCGSQIVTSSLDGTVKIWTSYFQQVGLYICSSPVLTMALIPSSRDAADHNELVCGTQLGKLVFLAWKK